jgi:hypothetical protein
MLGLLAFSHWLLAFGYGEDPEEVIILAPDNVAPGRFVPVIPIGEADAGIPREVKIGSVPSLREGRAAYVSVVSTHHSSLLTHKAGKPVPGYHVPNRCLHFENASISINVASRRGCYFAGPLCRREARNAA